MLAVLGVLHSTHRFGSTGMLAGGGAFSYEISQAALYPRDTQFGTVAVQNSGGAYNSGRTYVVQVSTTACLDSTTPVLVTQVLSEQAAAPPSRTPSWVTFSNMPCGLLPSRNANSFNIWFTPANNIAVDSELWFHWFIPYKPRPVKIETIIDVSEALP